METQLIRNTRNSDPVTSQLSQATEAVVFQQSPNRNCCPQEGQTDGELFYSTIIINSNSDSCHCKDLISHPTTKTCDSNQDHIPRASVRRVL